MEQVSRRRRARRRARRAAGRALVARRLRLLPDVLARQRDERADLGAAARRTWATSTSRSGMASSARSASGFARTSTGTGASTCRRRRSSAPSAGRSTPSRTSAICRGSSRPHDRARLRRRRGRDRLPLRRPPRARGGRLGALPARGACAGAERSTACASRGGPISLRASRPPARRPSCPAPDLVIVATKANGLEAAAASLGGHWPDAAVMTVLNGLGAEEVVARHGDVGDPLRGDVHLRHEALGHARRVHPRHGDVDRPVRRRAVRARAGGGRADRPLGPGGGGAARPASGAVVEADLQRDGERRRRADRAAARLPLRGGGARRSWAASSAGSSTRGRRLRRRPASSCTTIRGR